MEALTATVSITKSFPSDLVHLTLMIPLQVASVEAASTAVETKYLSLKQELEAAKSENSTASERALRDADAAASEVPEC